MATTMTKMGLRMMRSTMFAWSGVLSTTSLPRLPKERNQEGCWTVSHLSAHQIIKGSRSWFSYWTKTSPSLDAEPSLNLLIRSLSTWCRCPKSFGRLAKARWVHRWTVGATGGAALHSYYKLHFTITMTRKGVRNHSVCVSGKPKILWRWRSAEESGRL